MARRPTWLTEPCPSWCDGEHHEDDHPDDRTHRSVGISLPALTRRTTFDGDRLLTEEEAVDIEIGLSRPIGSTTTWVCIGDGKQQLELSFESMRRLLSALDRALPPTDG